MRHPALFSAAAIILLLSASITSAQNCAAAFAEGNRAYQQGDYEEARSSYLACLEANVRTVHVYYNLGNTYFRLDSLGKAILYYESALRLDPGNADIRHNLEFAETRKVDKPAGELEENPVLQGIHTIHHALSLHTQLWLLAGLAWLLAALLLTHAFIRAERYRHMIYGGLTMIILLAFPGILSAGYKIWLLETRHVGVVITRTADIYSGPGKHYQVLNELNEGTSLDILSRQDDWISIRVDDRIGGFVQASQIGIVR